MEHADEGYITEAVLLLLVVILQVGNAPERKREGERKREKER